MTLWSRYYEKQGGKLKPICQNIFHSRAKSDHHSLLVASHWKYGSQAAVLTEYFSVSVNIDMLCWWNTSICSQQKKTWRPWRFHGWMREGLKYNRCSTNSPSYPGSHSQTKASKREFKGVREKGHWKNWKGQRGEDRRRHLGVSAKEGLEYGNLDKSCETKKGKGTEKHEKEERKKIEHTHGKRFVEKECERCNWEK